MRPTVSWWSKRDRELSISWPGNKLRTEKQKTPPDRTAGFCKPVFPFDGRMRNDRNAREWGQAKINALRTTKICFFVLYLQDERAFGKREWGPDRNNLSVKPNM